jgi:hypothetical protein
MNLQRLVVTLACLSFGGVAAASGARVRWRGIAVEGRAPAALKEAVAAHVAVALRSLGSSVVTGGADDAEAAASCAFPTTARVARCVVVVQAAHAARVERRAEIRYRDAEDLAESLALLVSDILTSEFSDVVGGHANPPPTQAPTAPPPQHQRTTPVVPPPTVLPPPTADEQRAHEAEMQRQLEIVRALQRQADAARADRAREQQRQSSSASSPSSSSRSRSSSPSTTGPPSSSPAASSSPSPSSSSSSSPSSSSSSPSSSSPSSSSSQPTRRKLPVRPRLAVDLGAVGSFGLGPANPTLAGGAARVLYAHGLWRAGASLSLSGMRETLDGHDLSFFRALVAARAGIGFANAVADFDLTAGPALLVLVDDAHSEGRHAVASLAFVAGPRIALTLSGPVALVAGADFSLAVTDETVVAGSARVAQFSRGSVEVTLGIAWRSGPPIR